MVLLKLFFTFFKIGLFAIGGAYSFLPLVERETVQYHHWLDKAEFLDVVGIVAVFPGAISIKFATYTGYKVAGIPGAAVANLGNLLPPVLLILLATYVYSKYRDLPAVKGAFTMVQYAVFAMIIAVAIQLVDVTRILQLKYLIVIAMSLALFVITKVHPAFIIVGAGAFGAILELMAKT
jgi:chromate transporter